MHAALALAVSSIDHGHAYDRLERLITVSRAAREEQT
jgi:hypothetical protein